MSSELQQNASVSVSVSVYVSSSVNRASTKRQQNASVSVSVSVSNFVSRASTKRQENLQLRLRQHNVNRTSTEYPQIWAPETESKAKKLNTITLTFIIAPSPIFNLPHFYLFDNTGVLSAVTDTSPPTSTHEMIPTDSLSLTLLTLSSLNYLSHFHTQACGSRRWLWFCRGGGRGWYVGGRSIVVVVEGTDAVFMRRGWYSLQLP